MVANNLSRLLASLRNQVRSASQARGCRCLIVLAILPIPLLFFVLFNLADEMGLSQAVTTLDSALILETPSQVTMSDHLGTLSELLPWWQNFRTGFVRGFWRTVLALPISVLLWCLVVLLVGAFRRLLRNLPQGQIVRKVLIKREKAITFLSVFLLLVVLVPTVILLLQDVSLSASEFVSKYILELFVSVMLVALTVGTWKLLVRGELLDDTLVVLDREEIPVVKVQEMEQALSLNSKLLAGEESLGDILVALDHDEITQSETIEIQQIHSLEKWLWGNDTGWYELLEMKHFPNGLYPSIQAAVKRELQFMEQRAHKTSKEKVYEQRLQLLLSP